MAQYVDPQQADALHQWEDKPYPYQPGGSFLGGGQGQSGSALSAAIPAITSLFAPRQPQEQQAPQQAAPPAQTGSVPQTYNFGPEQDEDLGLKSEAFASSLGQGVLSASQNAARQAQQRSQRRLGQPGQQSDPYAGINSGGGWNVGGMSGISGT